MKPETFPPIIFLALIATGMIVFLLAADFTIFSTAAASRHYTEKQMTVLADRVGKTFWIQETNNRTPSFSSGPDVAAALFRTRAGDSFEIVGLVGRKKKNPYYKVRFNSGKEGYLRPEVFLEEFNLTILTVDPLADERHQAAARAEEERKRVEWINARAWSSAVKEAALKGQVVPGMNRDEVTKIAGAPIRISKVQPRGTTPEEHWFYPDGKQLIFHEGLLSQTILKDAQKP